MKIPELWEFEGLQLFGTAEALVQVADGITEKKKGAACVTIATIYDPTNAPVNVSWPSYKIGNAPVNVSWPLSEIGNASANVSWPSSEIGNAPVNVSWPSSKIGNAPVNVSWPLSKIGNASARVCWPLSNIQFQTIAFSASSIPPFSLESCLAIFCGNCILHRFFLRLSLRQTSFRLEQLLHEGAKMSDASTARIRASAGGGNLGGGGAAGIDFRCEHGWIWSLRGKSEFG